MAKLQAEVLLREFNYNGVRIPDPAPQMSVEQVRDLLTPHLSGNCDRNPHRPGRHRNHAALHLQPRDRIEGVSRARARDVARRTGGVVPQEGRGTASGSQSHPGEASQCRESCDLAQAVSEAIRQYVAPGSYRLPTPPELLPPLG
jgi:hypothetical protein